MLLHIFLSCCDFNLQPPGNMIHKKGKINPFRYLFFTTRMVSHYPTMVTHLILIFQPSLLRVVLVFYSHLVATIGSAPLNRNSNICWIH